MSLKDYLAECRARLDDWFEREDIDRLLRIVALQSEALEWYGTHLAGTGGGEVARDSLTQAEKIASGEM